MPSFGGLPPAPRAPRGPAFGGESKEMLRRRSAPRNPPEMAAAPPGLRPREADGGRSLEPEYGAELARRSGLSPEAGDGCRGGARARGGRRLSIWMVLEFW